METDMAFASVQVSFIIAIFLVIVYSYFPTLHNKWKIGIALILGVGFGLLKISYDGLPWTVVNVVDNLLQGFLVGASAVGIDQMRRNVIKQPPTGKK